jgi:hypothetical protein
MLFLTIRPLRCRQHSLPVTSYCSKFNSIWLVFVYFTLFSGACSLSGLSYFSVNSTHLLIQYTVTALARMLSAFRILLFINFLILLCLAFADLIAPLPSSSYQELCNVGLSISTSLFGVVDVGRYSWYVFLLVLAQESCIYPRYFLLSVVISRNVSNCTFLIICSRLIVLTCFLIW